MKAQDRYLLCSVRLGLATPPTVWRLVGAYSVLEERGYQPVNMAGASPGAILAALLAVGRSADELYHDNRLTEDSTLALTVQNVRELILITGLARGQGLNEYYQHLLNLVFALRSNKIVPGASFLLNVEHPEDSGTPGGARAPPTTTSLQHHFTLHDEEPII